MGPEEEARHGAGRQSAGPRHGDPAARPIQGASIIAVRILRVRNEHTMHTMKIALSATVTALTAVVVYLAYLACASPGPLPSQDVRAGPVAAAPGSGLRPSPIALPRPLPRNEPSPPRGAMRMPGSELVSYDVPDAKAPVPALQPPPDDQAQVAELQRLVAQSMQQAETLGHIDEDLAAQRQQAADEEARRQAVAEREATQQVVTLQALGTLRQAQVLLATGNSDGLDDELARAEATLSGRTQLDVDAAREALARSDLFQTRQYLAAALAESRALR